MSNDDTIDLPHPTPSLLHILNELRLQSDERIYHYCSANTLLSILENRTIRFGEASRMNDGEELLWAEQQLKISMTRLHDRDDVPSDIPVVSKKILDDISREYEDKAKYSRQFLACFSTNGDSLSQWRAYADDAQGFSIGFDSSCLDIPAQLSFVEYDPTKQQNYIMRAIAAISEESKNNSYTQENLHVDITFLYGRLASFKNPAFVDEREVRANHLAGFISVPEQLPALEYSGGSVDGKEIDDVEIKFRAVNHKIVPYMDFKFELFSECAVREIWIGPRCPNSKSDIEVFLGTLGYNQVEVNNAGSKYRA